MDKTLIKALQKEMKHGADPATAAALCGISAGEILDYSSNINPLGYTEEIRQAVLRSLDEVRHYPEPYAETLKRELARRENLPLSWIHCGNGGADLIFRVAMALRISSEFTKRQDVLTTAPNFREYRDAFGAAGFTIRDYFLSAERAFQLDEGILEEIRPELSAVLICNPNNPTGVTIKAELLRQIRRRCREMDVTLVADECFLDFLEPERQKKLAQRGEPGERLVVLKSFTKLYAIPALRSGWLHCSDPDLSERIKRLTPPWQCSGPARAASLAALRIDPEVQENWRRELARERVFLREVLSRTGASGITGEANYLFFRHPDPALQAKLLLPPGESILIRSCANYEGLSEEYFRVAVRGREENRRLARKLEEIGKSEANE